MDKKVIMVLVSIDTLDREDCENNIGKGLFDLLKEKKAERGCDYFPYLCNPTSKDTLVATIEDFAIECNDQYISSMEEFWTAVVYLTDEEWEEVKEDIYPYYSKR